MITEAQSKQHVVSAGSRVNVYGSHIVVRTPSYYKWDQQPCWLFAIYTRRSRRACIYHKMTHSDPGSVAGGGVDKRDRRRGDSS